MKAKRSLVLIDDQPLRRRWVDAVDTALSEIEQMQAVHHDFVTLDGKMYEAWFHREFDGLIRTRDRSVAQIARLEQMFQEIAAQCFVEEITEVEAFDRSLRRAETLAHGSEQEREAVEFDLSDLFDRASRKYRQAAAEEGEEDLAGFSWTYQEPEPAAPTAASVRRLFLELAKLLHPDAGRVAAAWGLEYWQQARTYYENQNVEALTALLALSRIRAGEEAALTCAEILQAQHILRDTMEGLARQQRQDKKNPAWGFSRKRRLKQLKRRIERSLQAEIERLGLDLRTLQGQWCELKRRSQARTQRRSSRSRKSADQPQLF